MNKLFGKKAILIETKGDLLAKIHNDEDPLFTEYSYNEWTRADKNKSGTLSKNEIRSLLRKLNIELKENEFEAFFKRLDADNSGKLDFVEFRNFLKELRERKELLPLFATYSKGKNFISKESFIEFLNKEQKEVHTADGALKLISRLPLVQDKDKVGFVAFSTYIASRENSVYNPAHTQNIYHNMKLPLPHYYIASSHNTYLTGHQLQGESSVEQYRFVLESGCRCVELDCWDGDDGEPIIYHGHTVVSRIKFEDVIKVIKEASFATSEYPVILSLENHCTTEQQVKMAKILKRYLGDLLAKPFSEKGKPLPSPHDLRRKIIIKGKRIKKDGAQIIDTASSEESGDEEEEEDIDVVGAVVVGAGGASSAPKTPRNELKISGGNIRTSSEKDKEKEKTAPKKHTHAIAPELSDITHLNSARFGGFDKDKDLAPWDMCSNSELAVKKYYKTVPQEMVKHNTNFLTRTYPKGTRFDSSNYSPIEGWALGCHMVALNYQTGDPAMFIYNGKFLDNGKTGYLLKPPAILQEKSTAPPSINLTIKVISGWQLPKASGTTKGEVIDPYVKVAVHGVGNDNGHEKTKVIDNNGFNPVWDTTMNFKIERPDLAQILLQVFDEDKLSKNDFIAYAALPVTSLREGYRSVHLYNAKSQPFEESSLLIHVTVTK